MSEEFEENRDNDGNAENDADGVSQTAVDSDTSFPSAMLFFILYGPYNARVNNFDITNCNFVQARTLAEWRDTMNKNRIANMTKAEVREARRLEEMRQVSHVCLIS